MEPNPLDASDAEEREAKVVLHVSELALHRPPLLVQVAPTVGYGAGSSWVYPLESYSRALEDAGFVIEALREPAAPDAEVEARPRAGRRWQRMPNFLMFRAVLRSK